MQFTFNAKSAEKLAQTVEEYLKTKGVTLKLGQAMDLIAQMQGFASGVALLAALRSSAGGNNTVVASAAGGEVSPTLLALAKEALEYECKAFEADVLVQGTELVDWFGAWRERLARALDNASDPPATRQALTEKQTAPLLALADELSSMAECIRNGSWIGDTQEALASIGTEIRTRLVGPSQERLVLAKEPHPQLSRPLSIYVGVYIETDGPSWAKIQLDQALLDRLLALQALVQEHQVMEVSEGEAPVWSWHNRSEEDADEASTEDSLEVERLEVDVDQFWYSAVTDSDSKVATRVIRFAELREAIKAGDSVTQWYHKIGDVILYGSEPVRRELADTLRKDGETLPGYP